MKRSFVVFRVYEVNVEVWSRKFVRSSSTMLIEIGSRSSVGYLLAGGKFGSGVATDKVSVA